MVCLVRVILIFVLADIAVGAVSNGTLLEEPDNAIKDHRPKTRRLAGKKNGDRSTSSSSGEQKKKSDVSSDRNSLEISVSDSSESGKKKPGTKSRKPKSSKERRGWKKWHRKCTPCPEDMRLKWRDPRVKWICGAYQRARRSFKSLCMMHYRNCQDGTMFTKIADHRCENSTEGLINQGEHFLYDYAVQLSDESSKSKDESKSDSSTSQKSSSSESWDSEKYGPRDMESEEFKKQINFLHKTMP